MIRPGRYVDISDVPRETFNKLVEAFKNAGAEDRGSIKYNNKPYLLWDDTGEVRDCNNPSYFGGKRKLSIVEILGQDTEHCSYYGLYRDGRCWPWTGGECPVNPLDNVECLLVCGEIITGLANEIRWGRDVLEKMQVVAFRVTEKATDERERLIDRTTKILMGMDMMSAGECQKAAQLLYDAGMLCDPADTLTREAQRNGEYD